MESRSALQMARDFAKAFVFSKEFASCSRTDFYKVNIKAAAAAAASNCNGLFDVCFLVGQGKAKTRLYGVRSILGVRSRHVHFMIRPSSSRSSKIHSYFGTL